MAGMTMNRGLALVTAVALAIVSVLSAIALSPRAPATLSGLGTFASYEDLERYLDGANTYRYSGGGPGGTGDARLGSLAAGYSGTNVQVGGVDELDTVKTDGTYVFAVSGNNVTMIRAYPPTEMAVVARITPADLGADLGKNETLWIVGIFVDEGRLAVVSQAYEMWDWCGRERMCLAVMPSFVGTKTLVSVFDLSIPEHPALEFTRSVSGFLMSARATLGYAYLVTNHYVYRDESGYVLPLLCKGSSCRQVAAQDIYFDSGSRDAYAFTSVLAVDLLAGRTGVLSVVTGFSSTLYMSHTALYMTYQKWDDRGDGRGSLVHATIYKVLADGTALEVAAHGDLPGYLWSQWALDEADGYLRVVTRGGDWSKGGTNVYVLDDRLSIVGSLEDIAPGEQLFATRFLEETLYLVTFRRVDPLFVIDLHDPVKPAVLGELTVPGFSTYLHPVDAGHILGIGQENGSIKVSLYDVTDPAHPAESASFIIEGYGWSLALYDHHAVLFDAERELFVIPVWIWVPERSYSSEQAYVFRVSTGTGIGLRGTVSHGEVIYGNVERSLYIGDYLYTVSYMMLKANALADLSEVKSIVYGTYP